MFRKPFALMFCALMAPLFARDITPAVLDGSLWQMDKMALGREFTGARFAPVDDNTLRFPRQQALEVSTLGVGELLMSFDEESKNVCLLQASVYNKGDDGDMDKKAFDELLESTIEKLNTLTGIPGRPRKVQQRDSGVKLIAARLWETEHGALMLEAAGTGRRKNFTAEFIRLTIGPDAESLKRGGAHDAASRSSLRSNTKEEENGDVWIEGIPMVDQGQKGYCVPATVSRVFAYYGMDGVDQHALAALCNSSGDGGTSMSAMETALKNISSKFHMRVTELDKGGLMAVMAEYNAMAKKMKKPGTSMGLSGPQFDADVLLAARAGKKAQVRKWMKPIKKSIDIGLPVLWSVQLAFPEPGLPQTGGGHMRLIIGYNEENDTIIYSDSWGAAHARKEMPAAQACAMTMYRYVLRPTR